MLRVKDLKEKIKELPDDAWIEVSIRNNNSTSTTLEILDIKAGKLINGIDCITIKCDNTDYDNVWG